MKVTQTILIASSLAFFCCFSSCSSEEKKEDSKKAYYSPINKFYEAAKNQDYLSMTDLCHNYWFKYWDNEKTVEYFTKIDNVEGKVSSWEILSIDDFGDFTGTGLEGKQVQVVTKVIREYVATEEMFIIYKEKGDNKFEILTYSVREIGLDDSTEPNDSI